MNVSRRRSIHRGHNSYGTSSAAFYHREEQRVAAARAGQSAALAEAVRPPTSEEIARHVAGGRNSEIIPITRRG